MSQNKLLTNRTAVGKITLRQHVVHDDDRLRILHIARIKRAPAQNRRVHRAKIVRGDREIRSDVFLSSRTRWLTGDRECRSSIVAGEWHRKSGTSRFDS